MEINKKKFIISGSTGFIGKNFTKEFNLINSNIWRLGKNLTGDKIIDADISKPGIWQDKLSSLKPNGVFHFAGISKAVDKKKFFEVNVEGTKNLLAGLKGTKTWLFIASTSAVYGDKLNEEIKAHENIQCVPINDYGNSKLKQEEIANTFSVKDKDIKLCIGRLSNIIGPNQSEEFFVSRLISEYEKSKSKKLFGREIEMNYLNSRRDFLDVRDLIKIILLLFNKKAVGTYNIGTGKDIELKNIITYCVNKYGDILKINDKKNNEFDQIYRQNIDIKKLSDTINLTFDFTLENTIDDIISIKKYC